MNDFIGRYPARRELRGAMKAFGIEVGTAGRHKLTREHEKIVADLSKLGVKKSHKKPVSKFLVDLQDKGVVVDDGRGLRRFDEFKVLPPEKQQSAVNDFIGRYPSARMLRGAMKTVFGISVPPPSEAAVPRAEGGKARRHPVAPP